jgi:hypothetical protein
LRNLELRNLELRNLQLTDQAIYVLGTYSVELGLGGLGGTGGDCFADKADVFGAEGDGGLNTAEEVFLGEPAVVAVEAVTTADGVVGVDFRAAYTDAGEGSIALGTVHKWRCSVG